MNDYDLIDELLSEYYIGKLDFLLDAIKLVKSKVVNGYYDYIYVTSGITYCKSQLQSVLDYLNSSYNIPNLDYIEYQVFKVEEELKLIQ